MKITDRLTGKSRGAAEAVSKALLFIMVLSVITALTTAGLQIVDNVYTEETKDQNVETLVEYHSNVLELSNEQGYGFPNTATATQQINTYRSSLLLEGNTSISIGSDITINSKPLVLSGNEYSIVYDAGIIGEQTLQNNITVSTPIDNTYLNEEENILPIITTTYNEKTMFSGKTSAETILLERSYSPETEVITSGSDKITVATNYPFMWETYLEDHSAVGDVNISGNSVEADLDEDIRIIHYNVEVKRTV